MNKDKLQFSGIVFFTGMDHLPRDILLSLEHIRKWALNEGLVSEKYQFLIEDRIQALSKIFCPEDQIQIALAIHSHGEKLFYIEYPFLPIRTLIRRGEEVELYYWQIKPTRWDANCAVTFYGKTRFGFIYPGCNEEICSVSTAKFVTQKFHSKLVDLSNEYTVKEFSDGSQDITVDGQIFAKFFNKGRHYDILFSNLN